MKEITTVFKDDNMSFKKFEAADLSNKDFHDHDFRIEMNTVSFFRSDFRGSKFTNIYFYKNEFDRSDFLNSVFINCTFEKVNFGCCQMKNCYFENVTFKNNSYMNTSIHSTTFVNCKFPDEKFLINMQRCKLENCEFSGCMFDRSTTDTDEFKGCSFLNTNLATMHAENHTFVDCTFENVFIGSSYYFGYLIANCTFTNVVYLYRGEYVSLDKLDYKEMAKKFLTEHRYTELLNVYKENKQNLIPELIYDFINYYKKQKYGRALDMTNMFNALAFSATYGLIDINIILTIIQILENEKWDEYSISEKFDIHSQVEHIKNCLFFTKHSKEYIANLNIGEQNCYITFKFDDDDFDKCIAIAESILSEYSDIKYWTLVKKQKGSCLLTYMSFALLCIYILPDIIVKYSSIPVKININDCLALTANKLKHQIMTSNSAKDLKEKVNLLKEVCIISTIQNSERNKENSELLKSMFIEMK